MKRFLIILASAILFICTTVAGEINYFNKSWTEIRAKAKAEHKYIFLDCYTGWCGWCKNMDKETMIDPGIVTIMNEKFIAVKMDMEKGEGIDLAMKYHVTGFPTFLFFDPDGDFVYEVIGYKKTTDFAKELNNVFDKNKQYTAPGFNTPVDVDFPGFYKMIFAGNGKREFPKEAEVTKYLDRQKDLFSEINWGVVSQCQLDEKYTKFFFDNLDRYKQLYGLGSVNGKLNSLLEARLMDAGEKKDEGKFSSLLKMVDKYVSDDPGLTKIYYRVYYYKETRDWDKCTDAINEYFSKKGYEDLPYINSLCWSMYESCDDKKLLKKAGTWMNKVVSIEPKYLYMDTYAAVLYKSGQVKDAGIWANKAIAAGKQSGDNTASSVELLKKINQ